MRLSRPEVRLLTRLLATQRTLVEVEDLAQVLGIEPSGRAEVLVLLRRLQHALSAEEGTRSVLRIREDEAAGIWLPRAGRVPTSEALLVGIGFDARRLAFRERPEQTSSTWHRERQRWEAFAVNVGGVVVEEGAAAMVIEVAPNPGLLDELRGALGSGGDGAVRLAVHAFRWVDGGWEASVEAAIAELSPLWERAVRGHLLLSDEARRVLGRRGQAHPLGVVQLADDASPQSVWAVEGPPHLLPASAIANLPVAPPVPERVEELQAVLSALEGGVGAVVLHGPGGSGKTDLALAVADRARVWLRGRGGVRFVRLPATGGRLDELVASELGMAGAPDEAEAVARALGQLGEALLVIDGFERSGQGSLDMVERWRRRAPRCAVLLTAPEPLRLSGAMQVLIRPWSDEVAAEALVHRLLRRGVQVRPSDHEAVVHLSRAVGGLPHGLAVTAGLVASLGFDEASRKISRATQGEIVPERQMALALEQARHHLSGSMSQALDRLAVLRGDFDVATASVVVEGAHDVADALVTLTDFGLLRYRVDAILGQLRLSVPGPVRHLAQERLPRAERRRIRRRALEDLARRGVEWSRILHSGRAERLALRRLVLARDELLAAIEEPPEALDVDTLVLGMLRLTELGRLGLGQLTRTLVGLPCTPAVALARARGCLAEGRAEAALRWAEEALSASGGIAEEAMIVHLHARAASLAESRAALGRRILSWEDKVLPRHLGAIGAFLDALLAFGMTGDALHLAERALSVARERGSVWRSRVIEVHLFRARAVSGRVRRRDRRELVHAIDELQALGDHRTAATALHWLVRHEAAAGRAESALLILDRVQSYLDTYANAAVQQLLVLDRARACALAGRPVDARRAHAQLESRSELAGRLPMGVRALDAALIELVDGRPDAAKLLLRLVRREDTPEVYAAIGELLHRLCAGWTGEPMPLPAASVRPVSGERALREIVRAWDDPSALDAAVERASIQPVSRTPELMGVVLRALIAAARRHRLAEPADQGGEE